MRASVIGATGFAGAELLRLLDGQTAGRTGLYYF